MGLRGTTASAPGGVGGRERQGAAVDVDRDDIADGWCPVSGGANLETAGGVRELQFRERVMAVEGDGADRPVDPRDSDRGWIAECDLLRPQHREEPAGATVVATQRQEAERGLRLLAPAIGLEQDRVADEGCDLDVDRLPVDDPRLGDLGDRSGPHHRHPIGERERLVDLRRSAPGRPRLRRDDARDRLVRDVGGELPTPRASAERSGRRPYR